MIFGFGSISGAVSVVFGCEPLELDFETKERRELTHGNQLLDKFQVEFIRKDTTPLIICRKIITSSNKEPMKIQHKHKHKNQPDGGA
jgi:hypothetical protein